LRNFLTGPSACRAELAEARIALRTTKLRLGTERVKVMADLLTQYLHASDTCMHVYIMHELLFGRKKNRL
jgi:hypothetical protein